MQKHNNYSHIPNIQWARTLCRYEFKHYILQLQLQITPEVKVLFISVKNMTETRSPPCTQRTGQSGWADKFQQDAVLFSQQLLQMNFNSTSYHMSSTSPRAYGAMWQRRSRHFYGDNEKLLCAWKQKEAIRHANIKTSLHYVLMLNF